MSVLMSLNTKQGTLWEVLERGRKHVVTAIIRSALTGSDAANRRMETSFDNGGPAASHCFQPAQASAETTPTLLPVVAVIKHLVQLDLSLLAAKNLTSTERARKQARRVTLGNCWSGFSDWPWWNLWSEHWHGDSTCQEKQEGSAPEVSCLQYWWGHNVEYKKTAGPHGHHDVWLQYIRSSTRAKNCVWTELYRQRIEKTLSSVLIKQIEVDKVDRSILIFEIYF